MFSLFEEKNEIILKKLGLLQIKIIIIKKKHLPIATTESFLDWKQQFSYATHGYAGLLSVDFHFCFFPIFILCIYLFVVRIGMC